MTGCRSYGHFVYSFSRLLFLFIELLLSPPVKYLSEIFQHPSPLQFIYELKFRPDQNRFSPFLMYKYNNANLNYFTLIYLERHRVNTFSCTKNCSTIKKFSKMYVTNSLLLLLGGAYIPPAKLKMLQEQIEDKSR